MTSPPGSPSEQPGDRVSTRRRPAGWRILAVVVVGALAAAGIGVLVASGSGSDAPVTAPRAVPSTAATPTASEVYEAIFPSLVFIEVDRATPPGDSIGSGVIVNANGQIMTAYHVVQDASAIRVRYADGTRSRAAIATSEPANDLATLQPDRPPEVIVPATLGSSRGLRIGDRAYSAGNPLGLAGSFSAGVISGLERTINPPGAPAPLTNLIQFDAVVNPGSSGGPLLNRSGQVVGIVSALANPGDTNYFIGIGFAVPIDAPTAGGGRGPNR